MRDADFRLKKPGMLNVTVVDASGQPVPEASVVRRAMRADGSSTRLSMSSTDASGKAQYQRPRARAPTRSSRARTCLTSADSARVKLDEGGSGEVQRRAAARHRSVLVTCVGGEDAKPCRASLSVQDESGTRVGAMISLAEAMKMFNENGFSTMERRVGPAPAREVHGACRDRRTGRSCRSRSTLPGQSERKITIHLD
jgi:hypothetical protein